MDAVKYFKARVKMTKNCAESCSKCGLGTNNNGMGTGCFDLEDLYPEKAVEIVENWLKQNTKTYMQDFLEKFPNAGLDTNGFPRSCRNNLYFNGADCKKRGCLPCWNELMED